MHRVLTAPSRQTNSERWLRAVATVLLCIGALLPAMSVQAQGVAPTPNAVLSLAVAPGAPNQLLAGVLNSPQPAGVYLSNDGAVTWVNSTPGLEGIERASGVNVAGKIIDYIEKMAPAGSGYCARLLVPGMNRSLP